MSITDIAGVKATGGCVGIKASGNPDAALIVLDQAVSCVGVFTQNKASAAPVQVSRAHLAETKGQIRAVLVTSGNANAATGAPGKAAAEALCEAVANSIGATKNQVLICQTGLIGIPFPLDAALGGVGKLAESLADDQAAGERAANAMLTTDTFAKTISVSADGISVAGMAKGAAMLAPNMATMLCVLATDSCVDAQGLDTALRSGIAASFNAMDIDGATSTNDTVLLLTTGTGPKPAAGVLEDLVGQACLKLAQDMVLDAEGATKAVIITVTGAEDDMAAHQGARKVANSNLVKCSLNGEDPYWGRVLSEIGTAGIACNPDLVTISYGGTVVSKAAVAFEHDEHVVASHMAQRWISIDIDLGLGQGKGSIMTTDLGHGYIDENRTTS
jgi:glutamate N-acetyltransferase/amino-acid N-acetyltransferase